jgi:hypothetical protein
MEALKYGDEHFEAAERRSVHVMIEKQSLTAAERDEMIEHLDQCLNIFSRKDTLLTAMDVQLKAMLSTVCQQLRQRASSGSSSPFSDR